MGNYNADVAPDVAQANMLICDYKLITARPIYTDQWTIDATNRVNSFRDGKNVIDIKIKSDPTQYPT